MKCTTAWAVQRVRIFSEKPPLIDRPKLRCSFVIIAALLFLVAPTTLPAYADKRTAQTLQPNQSLSIYSHRCTLSLKSNSTSRVVVQCSKANKKLFKTRPVKQFYLTPKQVATIDAQACSLQVQQKTSGKIKLSCIIPPSPTATPTQTPSSTPTPTPSTTLSVSLTNLALSVTGLTEFGVSGSPASGLPRLITVSNTGSFTADNLNINLPTFPSGTASSNTCGSSLSAGSSCTITITPGNIATSTCTTGTSPVPGTITISADNSNTASTNVVVLGYGCIYQGGYVYAFDDTTLTSGSVGGKVVATTDQAVRYPSGIIWGSNGLGRAPEHTSFDMIPLISELSGPSYSLAQEYFNASYSNTDTFPFPPSSTFASCSGVTDGSCNTRNILTFYDNYVTNYGISESPFSLSAGPTNLSYYAAGLCVQTISGYSDWYLPAICEMGLGPLCPPNQSIDDTLPDLLSDSSDPTPSTSCALGAGCLVGYYWSSTGYSFSSHIYSQFYSWNQYFNSGGGSTQLMSDKSVRNGVRCSRKLTF